MLRLSSTTPQRILTPQCQRDSGGSMFCYSVSATHHCTRASTPCRASPLQRMRAPAWTIQSGRVCISCSDGRFVASQRCSQVHGVRVNATWLTLMTTTIIMRWQIYSHAVVRGAAATNPILDAWVAEAINGGALLESPRIRFSFILVSCSTHVKICC